MIKITTLKNGIRVVTEHLSHVETISLAIILMRKMPTTGFAILTTEMIIGLEQNILTPIIMI